MSSPILLDTCAALWLTEPSQLADTALQAIREASGLLVSPISAWEVGILVSRGRLPLNLDPAAWFSKLIASGVELTSLSPEILIASSFLPGSSLRDPADRIIVATARNLNLPVMTRDRAWLDYAVSGHVRVIPC